MLYIVKRLRTTWKDVHALYVQLDNDNGLSQLHFAGLETETAIEAYTVNCPKTNLHKPLGQKLSVALEAFESLVIYNAVLNLFDENGPIMEEWDQVVPRKEHKAIQNHPNIQTTDSFMKAILDGKINRDSLKDFPGLLLNNQLRVSDEIKQNLVNVDNLAATYSSLSTTADMARFIYCVYQDREMMKYILNTWYRLKWTGNGHHTQS